MHVMTTKGWVSRLLWTRWYETAFNDCQMKVWHLNSHSEMDWTIQLHAKDWNKVWAKMVAENTPMHRSAQMHIIALMTTKSGNHSVINNWTNGVERRAKRTGEERGGGHNSKGERAPGGRTPEGKGTGRPGPYTARSDQRAKCLQCWFM